MSNSWETHGIPWKKHGLMGKPWVTHEIG